jgi:hypothetical protein
VEITVSSRELNGTGEACLPDATVSNIRYVNKIKGTMQPISGNAL